MRTSYENIVWDLVEYTDKIEEIVKNLSVENSLLHKRLQLIELLLTKLVSKEPIR